MFLLSLFPTWFPLLTSWGVIKKTPRISVTIKPFSHQRGFGQYVRTRKNRRLTIITNSTSVSPTPNNDVFKSTVTSSNKAGFLSEAESIIELEHNGILQITVNETVVADGVTLPRNAKNRRRQFQFAYKVSADNVQSYFRTLVDRIFADVAADRTVTLPIGVKQLFQIKIDGIPLTVTLSPEIVDSYLLGKNKAVYAELVIRAAFEQLKKSPHLIPSDHPLLYIVQKANQKPLSQLIVEQTQVLYTTEAGEMQLLRPSFIAASNPVSDIASLNTLGRSNEKIKRLPGPPIKKAPFISPEQIKKLGTTNPQRLQEKADKYRKFLIQLQADIQAQMEQPSDVVARDLVRNYVSHEETLALTTALNDYKPIETLEELVSITKEQLALVQATADFIVEKKAGEKGKASETAKEASSEEKSNDTKSAFLQGTEFTLLSNPGGAMINAKIYLASGEGPTGTLDIDTTYMTSLVIEGRKTVYWDKSLVSREGVVPIMYSYYEQGQLYQRVHVFIPYLASCLDWSFIEPIRKLKSQVITYERLDFTSNAALSWISDEYAFIPLTPIENFSIKYKPGVCGVRPNTEGACIDKALLFVCDFEQSSIKNLLNASIRVSGTVIHNTADLAKLRWDVDLLASAFNTTYKINPSYLDQDLPQVILQPVIVRGKIYQRPLSIECRRLVASNAKPSLQ